MSTDEDAPRISNEVIDRRIARALQSLGKNAETPHDIIDAADCFRVAHELESPREAAQPARQDDTSGWVDDNQKPATTRNTDAEIRAAVRGRTTPDGRAVRWVAWDHVGCYAFSTDAAPRRNGGAGEYRHGLHGSHGEYCYRGDLNDPARAGTTLFVGAGADPREQAAPTVDPKENLALRSELSVVRATLANAVATSRTRKHIIKGLRRRLALAKQGQREAAPTTAPDALPPLDDWGVCSLCREKSCVCGNPPSLPPLREPRYCVTGMDAQWRDPDMVPYGDANEACADACRIARDERAARERERAELAELRVEEAKYRLGYNIAQMSGHEAARQRDVVIEREAGAKREIAMLKDALVKSQQCTNSSVWRRERDAAQETAARALVERNTLRAKLEAARAALEQ
ncbi:MAG: hypothetical protein WC273_10625 [Dehalococcoidia bacterium]